MLRTLYTAGLHLALPAAFAHLAWRGRRDPEYRRHWGERVGRYRPENGGAGGVWIHALSVGETRAAVPLVRAIRDRFPQHPVLLTHVTPAGRAAAEEVFGETVQSVYLPYDLPWAVRAFLARFRPRVGILMETEVWPNLVHLARRQGVPMMLANARLSARSFARYSRIRGWVGPAIASLEAVLAQGARDAERLTRLGARNVRVCGNLKFDATPNADTESVSTSFRRRLGDRPVLLVASTRDGEEELVLDALGPPSGWPRDLVTVMVPRHRDRFDAVAALASARGLTVARRSDDAAVPPGTHVWVGDSMGEMHAYYAAADVALVGGSLKPYGGQNIIEPGSVGCPVVVGPHTFNFAAATEEAVARGAACQEADAAGAVARALQLVEDPATRRRMGEAGRAWVAAHHGATARTLEVVAELLARGQSAVDGSPSSSARARDIQSASNPPTTKTDSQVQGWANRK